MKKKLGFSFLEISIVIALISLIMLGIFQGGELINKAKINAATQMTRASIVGKMDGLTLWLETTNAIESFGNANVQDSYSVTNWHDLSSNGNDFTGGATYLTDVLNGLPVLDFRGGQIFSRSNVPISDIVQENQGTIFLVQNYSGSNSSTVMWQTGSIRLNVQALSGGILYFDFGTCCSASGRTTYTPTNFADKNNIITLVKYPSSAFISINGSVVATNGSASGSFATSTTSTFYIGSNGSNNFFGNIAEIIIFERALNDDEIADVEKYLSKKWGIAVE